MAATANTVTMSPPTVELFPMFSIWTGKAACKASTMLVTASEMKITLTNTGVHTRGGFPALEQVIFFLLHLCNYVRPLRWIYAGRPHALHDTKDCSVLFTARV